MDAEDPIWRSLKKRTGKAADHHIFIYSYKYMNIFICIYLSRTDMQVKLYIAAETCWFHWMLHNLSATSLFPTCTSGYCGQG
jgi:hypothetical protein